MLIKQQHKKMVIQFINVEVLIMYVVSFFCLLDAIQTITTIQGGIQVVVKKRDKEYVITNAHVVPYNAKLLLKYDCHINVEVCSTIRAVKYLYKYVYKANDRTMIRLKKNSSSNANADAEFNVVNEIKEYIDCRYISSIEAAYRLLEFNMHGRSPAVLPLMVHLPDQQYVLFDAEKTVEQLKKAIKKSRKTTLQAWFENNLRELENPLSNEELGYDIDGNLKPRGPELLYHEYPKYYAYENGKFHRRKGNSKWQLGRLHTAHASQGQRWYLRILLTHVRGATGYLDLLTHTTDDGKTKTYNCFKKRCIVEGLLKNDKEWDNALKEASEFKSAPQLRRLFALIIKECHPQDVQKLFRKYRNNMIEDMEYQYKRSCNTNLMADIPQNVIEKMYNSALYEVCSILQDYNVNLTEHDLIQPSKSDCFKVEAKEIVNERKYNSNDCKLEYETKYNQMNNQQKAVFDELKDAIDDEHRTVKNNLFFIDAPGGTVCFRFVHIFSHL